MTLAISPFSKKILEVLRHSKTYKINNQQNNLELFTCPINANQFDYNLMIESLIESVADFSISRKTKEKYKNSPMIYSKKAREKFRNYKENKGELGEFLLFCFLEGHLNAPKILSKLELKTSTNMYVNGSDGIHFLKLPNGNFRTMIDEHVNKIVTKKISNIEYYIKRYELFGYNFYVYTMPFLDIELSSTKILEILLK